MAEQVTVSVDHLDQTMSRAVSAFVETSLSTRFRLDGSGSATVLLVDLDQPDAGRVMDALDPDRVVVAFGFEPETSGSVWQYHIQKPVTASALERVLGQVEAYLHTLTTASPSSPTRASHLQRALRSPQVSPKGRFSPASRPGRGHAPLRPAARNAGGPVYSGVSRTPAVSGHSTAADQLADPLDVVAIADSGFIDLADPAVLASHRYTQATHLDGQLRQARSRRDRYWCLHGHHVSVASGEDGRLWLSAALSTFEVVCRDDALDVWAYERRRRPVNTDGWHSVRADVVAWNTAIWSSRGRLPDTIDPFTPLRIRAWPDLTRYALTPYALAVTALLAAEPCRLADMPEALGVPASQVFAPVAALDAVGLLQARATKTVGQPARSRTRHRERGVLRRFLDRLRDQ